MVSDRTFEIQNDVVDDRRRSALVVNIVADLVPLYGELALDAGSGHCLHRRRFAVELLTGDIGVFHDQTAPAGGGIEGHGTAPAPG